MFSRINEVIVSFVFVKNRKNRDPIGNKISLQKGLIGAKNPLRVKYTYYSGNLYIHIKWVPSHLGIAPEMFNLT
jgi:hypothetical protein